MNNESSKDLKDALRDADIKYQLVPPHNHITSFSEKAIQTSKGSFMTALVSLNPVFPISEWIRIVEQGELALNIIRATRSNPKLSAFAYLFGQFDYYVTPPAPPDIYKLTHSKPSVITSRGLKREERWTVGPSIV